MPTVPGQERRVGQAAIRTGRVQTDAPISAFGGGQEVSRGFQKVSQSIDQAFQGVEKIHREAREKADTARVFDATAKLNKFYDEKRQQVDKSFGENAMGLPDEIVPEIDTTVQEIHDSLANDSQKEQFNKAAVRSKLAFNRKMNDHVNREFNKTFTAKTESLLQTNFKNAVDNFADENAVKDSIKDSKEKYTFFAKMQGIPKEQRDLKLAKLESDTHIAVINRMADGGADQNASAYYKKNKSLIDPVARGSIEKALDESNLRGNSQRKTQEIVGKFGTGVEALDKARQIKDPKLQDDVVRRIKSRNNEKEQLDRQREEETFQGLFDTLTENGGNMDSLSPSQMTALPANLQRSLEARSKELLQGKSISTDLGTYYNLEQMASTPALQSKFLKTNILDLRAKGKLSDTDFKKVSKWQADLRGKKANQKELDGIQTKTDIVNNQLSLMDVDTSKNADKDDIQKEMRFRSEVDKRVVSLQEKTGKPVTRDELRQITRDLSVEVVTNRNSFWWDTKKRLFEVAPGDTVEVEFDDIPQQDKDDIKAALRSLSVPETEENIQKYYIRKVNVPL